MRPLNGPSDDPWQQFELLPADYLANRQARRTLLNWVFVLLLLCTAVVFGLYAATQLTASGRVPQRPYHRTQTIKPVALQQERVSDEDLRRLEAENRQSDLRCSQAEAFIRHKCLMDTVQAMRASWEELANSQSVSITFYEIDVATRGSDPYTSQNELEMVLSISIQGRHDIQQWIEQLRQQRSLSHAEVVASTKIQEETLYTIAVNVTEEDDEPTK